MMSDSTAKRKASDIALPAKGKDAAERKRVLNVLAQRRYRQRRREHVKKLEEQADTNSSRSSPAAPGPLPAVRGSAERSPDKAVAGFAPQPLAAVELPPGTVEPSALETPAYTQGPPEFDDPFSVFDANFCTAISQNWDSLLPSIPGSPFTASDPTSESDNQGLSLTSFSSPGSIKSANTPHSFADEANFKVIELDILRGASAIASRLNINDLIWSLDSVSPFADPAMAFANFDHLPLNLRPTRVQKTIQHHPIIDLMPWPTVRDKLIYVLSQPAQYRPPKAGSPTALLEFVYDVEDSAEGVRIWGEDPYSDQSWEVGEKVFKNWWWAFDANVIRRSNQLRQSRGAKLLGEGSILGEVM